MNKRKRVSIITMVIVFLIILNIMLLIITPVVNNSLKNKDVYIIDREKITQLPKLYFTGDMSNMTEKKDVRDITVKYEDGINKSISMYAQIKIQGSGSLKYPKKNYTITFYKDSDHSQKQKVDVGFGAQSKYCLKADWVDSATHARNIVGARLAAVLQDASVRFKEAPNNGLIDGFPIEIYLNNEYLGLYTWNIPKDAWMWALDEDNTDNVVVAVDGHTEVTRFKQLSNDWDEDKLKVEAGQYSEELKNNFNDLITFVKDSTDEEFVEYFEEHIDLESALNYVIIANVINGYDNSDKNFMMVSYDQKIWYPSLYDLDSTFGQDYWGKNTYDYEYLIDKSGSVLWERFTKLFKNQISLRYTQLRKYILTKEYIMNLFDSFKSTIPEDALIRDRERWPDAPGLGYEQIEEYLDYKLPYLDEYYSRENP